MGYRKGGPHVYWIALGLVGGSLAVSVTTLSVVLGVRRSTRRSERSGEERLEILREQPVHGRPTVLLVAMDMVAA